MAIALDHLIIAVRDLERAVRDFRAAGLEVTAGGKHDHLPTTNALIPCSDQTYLELLAFGSGTFGAALRMLAKTPVWTPMINRRTALEHRIVDGLGQVEGLIAIVLRVDDLDERVIALRANGFDIEDPAEFSRTTPSGDVLRWRLAATTDPTLPILIEDVTETSLRAAGRSDTEIKRVTVITDDLDRTTAGFQALLGPTTDGTWELGGTRIRLDKGTLSPRLPRLRARIGAPGLPRAGSSMGLSTVDADPGDAAVERLAQALRLQTVSYEDAAEIKDDQFVALGEHLEKSYPRIHSTLECKMFGHSRLYTWPGTDPERVAGLFLAHLDVVPVGDPDGWTHPPFAGVVDDEFIWGRGAIDDKSRVLALHEAIESALAAGEQPTGTLYFAFGHDEEIGGDEGAAVIAEYLRRQGVKPELLLDEGGVVTRGVVDGVDRPVASIMLGEKGFATVRLSTQDVGGHSSMPPKQTAVGRIARAVAALQDNPMPLRLTPVILDMVKRLAPFMSEPRRSLLGSADRLGPVITRVLTSQPKTEALVRTTTAPTVIRGGVKANVLPQHADALVNFRILQGDTIADVLAHCVEVVHDDRVTVELAPGMLAEPSPLTDSEGPAFALIAETAREILPDIAVTTGLVPGATDARHYNDVAIARINFAPIVIEQADLDRIHGTDERISRENYARLIAFNQRLFVHL